MKTFSNKFIFVSLFASLLFVPISSVVKNAEAQTAPSPVVFSRGVQLVYQTKYASQSVPGVNIHQLNGYRTYTAYWDGTFTYGAWQSFSAPMLTREITANDVADGWLASMDQASAGATFTQWPLYADEVSRINGNEAQLLATVRVIREANGETFPLEYGSWASGIWGPSTWIAAWNANKTSQLLNDWTQLSYPRPSVGSLGIPARIWPPIPGTLQTPPYVYTPAPVPTAPTPTVSYPVGCTSSSGFSSTTGQACSGISNLPPGCTSTSGFSATTGASCSGAGVTYPAGCTSSYGFSATTGKTCSGTDTPIPIPQPVTYAPYFPTTTQGIPTTSLISSSKVDLKVSASGSSPSNGPLNISLGTPVTISWLISGQTSCYKSSLPVSEFTGILTPLNKGSLTTYAPFGGIKYRITCGNFTDSVDVNTALGASSAGTGSSVSLPPATTPTPTTPTPPSVPSSPVASTKFQIGDFVQTTANLNVRSTANGTLVGTAPKGTQGTVVGGPVVAGGLNWWNINYSSGADGWSAENYLIKISTNTNPGSPPQIPQNVTAVLDSSSCEVVNVSFSQSSGATFYRVERGDVYVGGTDGSLGFVFKDQALQPGNYTYTVSASNLSGSSGPSNPTPPVIVSSSCVPNVPPPPPLSPPSLTIAVGSSIQLISYYSNINVRSQPTTASGSLLGSQPTGTFGTIIGGPIQADGYTWWNVDYETAPDGWSIENYMELVLNGQNFNRITVQSPVSGEVSGLVTVEAGFTPYRDCGISGNNCILGFFSAVLKNANSSVPYLNRIVGQSSGSRLQFVFDTNDFPDGPYILDLVPYNSKGAEVANIKNIPITIKNPPTLITFKYPTANSVISTPTFLMDVTVTQNGQPYIPTLVSYEVKPSNQPDTEYLSLGATYPRTNGGDSRGGWGCDFLNAPPGNYILKATLSKRESAILPITINWTCPNSGIIDRTAPTMTVLSPQSGDNSSVPLITLSATARDPGSSFGQGASSGVREIRFWIRGSSVYSYGMVSLSPDASGMVTKTWKVSDGVQSSDPTLGIVSPKPPFSIGVSATDNAGNTSDWVYIDMK